MSTHYCVEIVRGGGGFDYFQCGNKAKVERDGKHYCGTHDPVRRAVRQAKRDAVYEAKMVPQRKRWAMNNAAGDLLEALKNMLVGYERDAGPDDPIDQIIISEARAAIAKAEGEK